MIIDLHTVSDLTIEGRNTMVSSPSDDCLIKNNDNTTMKTTTQRRRVHFSTEIMVYPRTDNPILEMDEIKARWLQDHEVRAIRHNLNQTLWLMRKGSPINEATHCTRGLEHLVNQKANMKARSIVVNSVLTEQDLQNYEGIRDVELIAEASRQFSREHRVHGYLRALLDWHGNHPYVSKLLGEENKLMELKRKSILVPSTRIQ